MWLTPEIDWPVIGKYIADSAQCSSCTRNGVQKSRGVQACFAKTHRLIQSMNRHGRIDVMNFISCGAYFLYCREQNLFIIKTRNNKFFYSHMVILLSAQ